MFRRGWRILRLPEGKRICPFTCNTAEITLCFPSHIRGRRFMVGWRLKILRDVVAHRPFVHLSHRGCGPTLTIWSGGRSCIPWEEKPTWRTRGKAEGGIEIFFAPYVLVQHQGDDMVAARPNSAHFRREFGGLPGPPHSFCGPKSSLNAEVSLRVSVKRDSWLY